MKATIDRSSRRLPGHRVADSRLRRVLGVLGPLAALSCSPSAATSADAGATGALPCDVQNVLEVHCQTCHQNPPLNGAPMPLMTLADLHAPSHSAPQTPVYALVETRIHDDQSPMPPAPNPRLDSADLATMDSWIDAGAPGDAVTCASDAAAPTGDASSPALDCASNPLVLAPASAWAMPTDDDDDYVCYGFDAPAGSIPTGTTRHVIGMTPNIVNRQIVHHVLLYQADESFSPTPTKCAAGGAIQWRIVYGWAPGGGAMQTPAGVGFPYDETTHWVVQVHYNNVNHLASETDTSGFSLCTTDAPVQYDADVIAFGTQDINIPPYSTLDQTCNVTVSSTFANIHLFAAFPHMHQLGMGIESEQQLGGGGVVDIGKNDPWNFNQQVWFPIHATLSEGDVVRTRCAWQNSTSAAVTFGQNTENEMCYSFTAYYPRVTTQSWSWALPALEATCAPTPDAGLAVPDAGWVVPAAPEAGPDGE